jgi:maltooligosyltrehalose synthase
MTASGTAAAKRSFRNVFTGETSECDGTTLTAATLFAQLPVALLVPCSI